MSSRSFTRPSPNQQSQPDALGDACSHIVPLDQIPKYDTRSALGGCSYPFSLLQVFRCEMRSLLGRIREAREMELYRRGVAVLPRWLGALIGSEYLTAQLCCNEDMQRIAQFHRWMSLTDTLVFLQGWTLGAAWAYRRCNNEHSSLTHSAPGNLADSAKTGEAEPSYTTSGN